MSQFIPRAAAFNGPEHRHAGAPGDGRDEGHQLKHPRYALLTKWLDLHDDYWDKQGRKSIDAVAVFGGLLTIGVAGRDMINELGLLPKRVSKLVERDQHRRETLRQAH